MFIIVSKRGENAEKFLYPPAFKAPLMVTLLKFPNIL